MNTDTHNNNFHQTFLRALEEQHACFGHRLPSKEQPCTSCVMQEACGNRQTHLLQQFASQWTLSRLIGADFEEQQLTAIAFCKHCRKPMQPDEGKVYQVSGKGAYHKECLAQAFPSP